MKHVVRLTWIAALLILLTSYLQPVASTFLTGTRTATAHAQHASTCQPPTPPTQEARLPAPSFGVDARFGYNVVLYGDTLVCGFAHPVQLTVPDGVTVQVTTPSARGDSDPAKFSVSGIDKQAVGEFAARCRRVRKPEPYKGKGVRYAGERIVRKVGKAFAGAGG